METTTTSKRKHEDIVYHGDLKCQHSDCPNKAYYKAKGKYLCGVHSKGEREALPKRSSSQKLELAEKKRKITEEEVENAKLQNVKAGKHGKVVLSRMLMMKEPVYIKGFLKVFPNFKHQNRKDGFGCMRLSPKFLGPIEHGQPGLPPSKNLENFHQLSVFSTILI